MLARVSQQRVAGQDGVAAVEDEEGRLLERGLDGRIVGEAGGLHVLDPRIGRIGEVEHGGEDGRDGGVESLHEAVGLRVIGRCVELERAEEGEQLHDQRREELRAAVGEQVVRSAVFADDGLDDDVGHNSGGDGLDRLGDGVAREVVDEHEQVLLALGAGGEGAEDVDCDALEGARRDGHGLRRDGGRIARDLAGLALRAAAHVLLNVLVQARPEVAGVDDVEGAMRAEMTAEGAVVRVGEDEWPIGGGHAEALVHVVGR